MKIKRMFYVLALLSLVLIAVQPLTVDASAAVTAQTAGFGAAFGYAQSIDNVSFSAAGTIGNGMAGAAAFTPFSASTAWAASTGPGAAYSQAIGTPFGSTAWTQVASLFGGTAAGYAAAWP
jgi:hypothetical protein